MSCSNRSSAESPGGSDPNRLHVISCGLRHTCRRFCRVGVDGMGDPLWCTGTTSTRLDGGPGLRMLLCIESIDTDRTGGARLLLLILADVPDASVAWLDDLFSTLNGVGLLGIGIGCASLRPFARVGAASTRFRNNSSSSNQLSFCVRVAKASSGQSKPVLLVDCGLRWMPLGRLGMSGSAVDDDPCRSTDLCGDASGGLCMMLSFQYSSRCRFIATVVGCSVQVLGGLPVSAFFCGTDFCWDASRRLVDMIWRPRDVGHP
jgi:hypothetical protein